MSFLTVSLKKGLDIKYTFFKYQIETHVSYFQMSLQPKRCHYFLPSWQGEAKWFSQSDLSEFVVNVFSILIAWGSTRNKTSADAQEPNE